MESLDSSYLVKQKTPVYRETFRKNSDSSLTVVAASSPSYNQGKRKAKTVAYIDLPPRKMSRNDSLSSIEDETPVNRRGAGGTGMRGAEADISSLSDNDAIDTNDERNRTTQDMSLLGDSRRLKEKRKASRRAREHAPSVSESNRVNGPGSQPLARSSLLTGNISTFSSLTSSAPPTLTVSPALPPALPGTSAGINNGNIPQGSNPSAVNGDEVITKSLLLDCFNDSKADFNKRFDDLELTQNRRYRKVTLHTKKHQTQITDLTTRLEALETKEKDEDKNLEEKIEKMMDEKFKERFHDKLRAEIKLHNKKLMFFNVKEKVPEAARKFVKGLIEGRQGLKEHQKTGIKFMKVVDLPKSNSNQVHDTTHVEVTFANEDLKIAIFQKLLTDKVLQARTDKLRVTDSIPDTYRSKAQYFDMKLKDYRDTMGASTTVRIHGVELQGWWATEHVNWVKQFYWTPKERFHDPDKDRDRRPKTRTKKVARSGDNDNMEVDGHVEVPLPQGTPLGDNELNSLGHSIIVKVKTDMKNSQGVEHFKTELQTYLTGASLKYKEVAPRERCYVIIFDTKEDRKKGYEHISRNKPFDEFEYARMTKH